MIEIAEPIMKVGIKTFVSVELLEKIQGRLMELPEKHKTQLEAKEAIAFLYQDICSALEKDYTLSEISQLLQSSGWEITENSLKYFWRISRIEKEKEKKGKKNAPSKNVGKEQNPRLNTPATENKDVAEALTLALEEMKESKVNAKSAGTKHKEKLEPVSKGVSDGRDEKPKDARFELHPDTEDL